MSEQSVLQEIRAVLDSIEAGYSRGAVPNQLMPLFYDDEIVAVGEGDPSAVRGLQELMPRAASISAELGPRPRVEFVVDMPLFATESVAIAMINATIMPDRPDAELLRYRMMTAWRPGKRGWRIFREMFTLGSL